MAKKKNDFFETKDLKVDKEDLANKVLRDFSNSEDSRTDWECQKIKNFESYEGILKKKTYPWEGCSNVNVPVIRIVVDTFWANLSSSFSTSSDMITAQPISADDVTLARKRSKFLNVQLKNEVKIEELKDKIFEISLKYGDCITKERYVHTERDKTDTELEQAIFDSKDGDIETFEVLYDGVKVDVPNIEDIYKAPESIGVQKETCEYIIHRVRLSRAEYMNRVATMGYPEIDFDTLKNDDDRNANGYDIDEQKKLDLGISETLYDTDNYVNILEWYGEYWNEKAKTITEIVAIVHPQSKKLLKAFINEDGFRPFTQFTPLPQANQPYGKGFPEVLKYMQAEMNTIHNQRRDSEAKRIAQPGFYDRGSSFNPKTYTMAPQGMYPTDGPPQQSVYFPTFQDAPQSSFREEQAIWQYVEQMTAIGKPIQGVIAPGERTATEVSNVTMHANIRFDLIFRRYEQSFLEMVSHIAKLDAKYMPEEKEFRVLGSEGRFNYESIKRSEFTDHLDLVFKGSSVSDEASENTKTFQIYGLLSQNPLVAGNPTAMYNVTRWTLERLDVKNIDKLIIMPPQAAVRTPQEEHEMMYKGTPVPVDIREDAQYHKVMHDAEMNQIGFERLPQNIQQTFATHLEGAKSLEASQLMMKNIVPNQNVGASDINPLNSTAAPQVGQGGIKPPEPPKAPTAPKPNP